MAEYYLYCIVSGTNLQAVQCRGLDDRNIYFLKYNDINVLYSDIRGYILDYNLNNLKTHNRVSMEAMKLGTVLPFQFGITVNDKDKMVTFCSELYDDIKTNIVRLRDRVEIGIKVFGEMPIVEIKETCDNPFTTRLASMQGDSASVKFLMKRYKKYYEEDSKERHAAILGDQLLGYLKAISEEYVISSGKTDNLLLNSSFLIDSRCEDKFNDEFARISQKYPQYLFIRSGPWPPYNFVRIKRDGV